MHYKNLSAARVWKLKKFCITYIELILNFCLSDFYFQFEFFCNFDFQMHKTHVKGFVFEISSLEIIGRPLISLMAKFEVYNVLTSIVRILASVSFWPL